MTLENQQLHAYDGFYDSRTPVPWVFFKGNFKMTNALFFSAKASPYLCNPQKEEHRLCTQNRAGESEAWIETESCDHYKQSCTNI